MDDIRGYLLGPRHGTTSAAVITNQMKKLKPFKSKEDIHKNEDESDCTVSNSKLIITLV